MLSNQTQCNPFTCPQNKQYAKTGLDKQGRDKIESSNTSSNYNKSSHGSDSCDLRNSCLSKSSGSQVLVAHYGNLDTAGPDVIPKHTTQIQFIFQALGDQLGSEDEYRNQETSEDFDEIVPTWLMDHVGNIDVQNPVVVPGIYETPLNGRALRTSPSSMKYG